MPGALYQGPFFVQSEYLYVRGPTGKHQIHQHQEHTCMKCYHSLWIPLLYPVIDTSVTPGAHL